MCENPEVDEVTADPNHWWRKRETEWVERHDALRAEIEQLRGALRQVVDFAQGKVTTLDYGYLQKVLGDDLPRPECEGCDERDAIIIDRDNEVERLRSLLRLVRDRERGRPYNRDALLRGLREVLGDE